jgi:hypothetical protein
MPEQPGIRCGSWLRENAEIELANGTFVSTSVNLKNKSWRWLLGQDNRENTSARFSCEHVVMQPGSNVAEMGRPHFVRSPPSDRVADIA